jgi:methylated-DNA-[protein]-cysteine S-methyltransferase
MDNLRLSLETSEDMTFGCLVDQREQLVASSFGSNSRLLQKHLAEYSTRTIGKPPIHASHWITEEMIRRFEGGKNVKSVRLNRHFVSSHQARVCAVLEQIPTGRVTTYGLISNRIGSGPRAVGGAVGSNPWSIFVPCHRVVPSNLTVGNYSMCGTLDENGSVTKRKLLVRESVPVDEDEIDPSALWHPLKATV